MELRRPSTPPVLALPVLVLAALTAACGGGGAAGTASCGEPVEEALDPAVLLHVLPGIEVTYLTDPPTSGPHTGAAPTGAVDEVLSEPVQVAVLERGDVLIQYDPQLPADQIGFVRSLTDDRVVTAPNDGLPAPVVATAWRWKLLCEQIDLDAIDRFVADHAGAVDGH